MPDIIVSQSVKMPEARSNARRSKFGNFVLKMWLLRVGPIRRREILQKLKSDLARLPLSRKEMRRVILQLTSEPRVLLRRLKTDYRYQSLKLGDIPFIHDEPQKEVKTGERRHPSCDQPDKKEMKNVDEKHSPIRRFDPEYNSEESSEKASEAEPFKLHRHDVKSTEATETVITAETKDCQNNSVSMMDSFGKAQDSSAEETAVCKHASSSSEKVNADTFLCKKQFLSIGEDKVSNNNTVSSLEETNSNSRDDKTKDALLKENASPEEKKDSTARSSDKTRSVPELLCERVDSGVPRIAVQLNIKQIKINFSELAQRRRVELSKQGRSPKRKHTDETLHEKVDNGKMLQSTESEPQETDQDSWDSPATDGHRKKICLEESILKLKKRDRSDEVIGFHEKRKHVRRNTLKKFRAYFGEIISMSEDEEDKCIAQMQKRRKKDSVDSCDSGLGIEEDQTSSKHVCQEVQRDIDNIGYTQQAAPDSTEQYLEEQSVLKSDNPMKPVSKDINITKPTGMNRELIELKVGIMDQKDENANVLAKNPQGPYQMEKCLSKSSISCAPTVSAKVSIDARFLIMDVCSSTIENLNTADNDADISEKCSVDAINTQIPKTINIDVGSLGSNARIEISSPLSKEVSSSEQISSDANNVSNIPNVADSNLASNSSESCEKVVNTMDVNGNGPMLRVYFDEDAGTNSTTQEDTTKPHERTTYTPDTSTNVQKPSEDITDKADSIEDIRQLLQMDLDKNCEIISHGNTVRILQNVIADKEKTIVCQEDEESDVAPLKIVEECESDSSHTTDVTNFVSTANVEEKEKVATKEVVNSIQIETATSTSIFSETRNRRVPEEINVNSILLAKTACTEKTKVPITTTSKLRVLSSSELGSSWCTTSASSSPAVSTTKSLFHSVASCVTSQPSTTSPHSTNNGKQNPTKVSASSSLKNRLIRILENITRSVKYLRYLREKNEFDKRVSDDRIRQKQMEQNLADFAQSVVKFRGEFIKLGVTFNTQDLDTLIYQTIKQLNLYEMKDKPLSLEEFQSYWQFTPNTKVIPTVTGHKTVTQVLTNVPSGSPDNQSVNTNVNASTISTGSQYASGSVTNNSASMISSNVPYQYNAQYTAYTNQQYRVSPVNNVLISPSQQPQRAPLLGRSLIEEHSAFLPTPLEQYNEQMQGSKGSTQQNTNYAVNDQKRSLQENLQRKMELNSAQPFANVNAQNNYMPRRPPPSYCSIQPRLPLNQSSNQFVSTPLQVTPAQQRFHMAPNTQRPISNQYRSQVQSQSLQTQVQNVQSVGQLKNIVQGNVQATMPQVMAANSTVTYLQQNVRQTMPQQVQRNIQQNLRTNVQENRQQNGPVIQNAFVNTTVQTNKVQNVERSSNSNTAVNNVLYNTPLAKIQSLVHQSGIKPVQTPGVSGMAINREKTFDPNVKSAQLMNVQQTNCFSILQKIMLCNQIRMYLSFPVKHLSNYMELTQIVLMQTQRIYLTSFLKVYRGYLLDYCITHNINTMMENRKQQGSASVTDDTKTKVQNCLGRKRTRRSLDVNVKRQQEQNTSSLRDGDDMLPVTESEITVIDISGSEETVSTETGKLSNDDSNARMSPSEEKSTETLNSNVQDKSTSDEHVDTQDIPNDAQKVSAIATSLRRTSVSEDTLNVSSTSEEVALEDADIRKPSPDATVISEPAETMPILKQRLLEKSSPVLDEIVPVTSEETMNAEELSSRPILHENASKDAKEVSNISENVSNTENDEQPKSSSLLHQDVHEESTLMDETPFVEEESNDAANSDTKELDISSSITNETEAAVPKLQQRLIEKSDVSNDLANTDSSIEESVELLDLNQAKIDPEALTVSPQDVKSQSTDKLLQEKSVSEFIKLEDILACEFQPNILDVRSISLDAFVELEDAPESKLEPPSEKVEFKDEIVADEEYMIKVEEDVKICLHCTRSSVVLCGRCLIAPYCSKRCQESHWKEHYPDCKPHGLAEFDDCDLLPLKDDDSLPTPA